jgi:hypothetical protein
MSFFDLDQWPFDVHQRGFGANARARGLNWDVGSGSAEILAAAPSAEPGSFGQGNLTY